MSKTLGVVAALAGATLLFAPAAAAVSVGGTVDPTGTYTGQTHTVTIRGTLTCTDAPSGSVQVFVVQKGELPRIAVGLAFGGVSLCDGEPQPWAVDVSASEGKFTGGRVTVDLFFEACNPDVCARFRVDRVEVKLVGH